MDKDRHQDLKDVHGGKIVCRCPKCEKTWETRLRWIGNGTCRKLCPDCKDLIEGRPEYRYHSPRQAVWVRD